MFIYTHIYITLNIGWILLSIFYGGILLPLAMSPGMKITIGFFSLEKFHSFMELLSFSFIYSLVSLMGF